MEQVAALQRGQQGEPAFAVIVDADTTCVLPQRVRGDARLWACLLTPRLPAGSRDLSSRAAPPDSRGVKSGWACR